MKKLMLTFIMLLSFSFITFAQTYQTISGESNVIIKGTSSVHDWESNAETFDGTAMLTVEDGKLVSVDSLTFRVKVDDISSGKRVMDKKTHGALKDDDHPYIIFNLNQIEEIMEDSLLAQGTLTIAGVTKNVQMEVAYEVMPDGSVTFSGSQPITMTEYEIEPPTAMLGALKTGEDVDVVFNTKFGQTN